MTAVAHTRASAAHGDARAGRAVALTLLLGSCLTIMGAVLIAPILPQLRDHFGDVPHIDALVPIALTVPALAIALLAPFAGSIVDRFGRKHLLLWSTALYAVFGTAPMYLQSLQAIVASRVGLGLCEAAIMTCCTTLIGDYYRGEQREKYLALQSVFAGVSSMVAFIAGGALGELHWRAPFALYGLSLVLWPLMAWKLWEPRRDQAVEQSGRIHVDSIPSATAAPLPWRRLIPVYLLTCLGMVAFYVVPVQMPFLLSAIGVSSPSTTGMIAACGVGATLFGAISFRALIRRVGTRWINAVSFLISGSGFVLLAQADTLVAIAVAVFVNGYGSGFLIPNLLNWLMGLLPFEQRGRGTGGWTASFYFGQFISPLVTLGLVGLSGSLSQAVLWLGAASIGLASLLALAPLLRGQPLFQRGSA